MMSAAARQKVVIIQPALETFDKRLDVVDVQELHEPWNTEDTIAALITNPAHVEVSLDDIFTLFLPDIGAPERSCFAVAPVPSGLWLLGADELTIVNPSAIFT